MPTQALILALVVIAGACAGVIIGRFLTRATRLVAAAPIADVEEPVFPVRELDAVLAPYERVAA